MPVIPVNQLRLLREGSARCQIVGTKDVPTQPKQPNPATSPPSVTSGLARLAYPVRPSLVAKPMVH
ncbi:hypothetical protein VTK73DRAFT_5597 [Phialemonium thermophilum]|uniref:Uncharacterized protein n=1 Tax=Phialemonium thermophilum TaxID=223376 RepID=A0ABR3V138_9PEZI